MEVGTVIDLYTTILGWLLYDRIWQALLDSGLAYLPFLAVLVRHFAKPWVESGADGAQASVRGLEVELAGMLTVAALCGTPMLELRATHLTYTAACGTSTVTGGNTGTVYDSVFVLGNTPAYVPVWWRAVMAVAGGLSNVTIAATPCGADLRRLDYRVYATPVLPETRAEMALFDQDCFQRARAKFANDHASLSGGYAADDIDWPGSRFFQDTDGYYGHANINLAWRASQEINGFPFDAARDAEYGGTAPASGFGKPTCLQWWADATQGLRARLLARIDPALLTDIQANAAGASAQAVEDAQVRKLYYMERTMLVQAQKVTANSSWSLGSNPLMNVVGTVGVAWQGLETQTMLYALKQAAPIGQALILMAIYLLLPFLLVFSSYRIVVVLMASVGIFALRYLTALWALANWLDTAMIQSLGIEWWKQNDVLLNGSGPTNLISNLVIGLMYVGLPLVWFVVLGWAGYNLAAGGLLGPLADPAGRGAAGGARGAGRAVMK